MFSAEDLYANCKFQQDLLKIQDGKPITVSKAVWDELMKLPKAHEPMNPLFGVRVKLDPREIMK